MTFILEGTDLQRKRERTSLFARFDGDAASPRFGDGLYNGQTQPGAAAIAFLHAHMGEDFHADAVFAPRSVGRIAPRATPVVRVIFTHGRTTDGTCVRT